MSIAGLFRRAMVKEPVVVWSLYITGVGEGTAAASFCGGDESGRILWLGSFARCRVG